MFRLTRGHLQVIQVVQEGKLNLSFAYTRMYAILMEAVRVVLLNTVHLLYRSQHRLILIAPYMYATCFGTFVGYPLACQCENYLKEDTLK